MQPTELRRIRRRLQLTQAELAVALKVPQRTYENWEQGRNPIKPYVRLAVKHIESVLAAE